MYAGRESDRLKASTAKDKSPKTDNYEDDEYEEIDEEIEAVDDMDGFAGMGGDVDADRPSVPKIGDSHGITVSQSLGIDPSVDSLQLEEYDHIEDV